MNTSYVRYGVISYFAFFSFCVSAYCFEEAGWFYDINPNLLEAIAYTESRLKEDSINTNANGTSDYGLMQINSSWFKSLSDLGVSESDVINKPCVNVFVGAWVLAQNFKSHGENWLSVGAYNAGFLKSRQKHRDRYVVLIKENLKRITERELNEDDNNRYYATEHSSM